MATIALYANKINQMPGMINEVKRAVTDYKSELLALKMKTLTINKSVCNLEDVIRSIQASTQTQDEKVNSLELFYQNSERFITEVVSTDEKVADIIRQRKNDFYEEYSYLKPECEKEWLEQAGDWFVSVGEWCKEHWKAAITIIIVAASVIVIVAVPAAAPILIAAAKGVIFGAVTGGLMGGLTSLALGGSFLEGLENGAFMGAISGIIAGGMTFGFTKGVEGVRLTLGQCIAVGTGGGAGSQFLSDIGDIFIKKEKISFGEVIFNTAIAGGIGGIFGAVGYGASKGWSALKLKIGGGESGSYSGLRDLMSPEEVARYDKYWNNVADDMLKSNLSDFRSAVLSGDITKTTGGKINSKVVTAAIDTNTGDIYFGISGMNNNPTRNMTNPQMQEILNSVNGSMTNYPLENCGEFNAINNALNNGVNIQNLRVYSIDRVSGNYKAPCINCQNLYGDIVYFKE